VTKKQKNNIARRVPKFKLGIVGLGFVGKAVDYAFSTDNVKKMIVDPKYNENSINDLCDFEPNCVFICAPTPSKEDGSIDSSLVEDAVMRLVNRTEAFIIIKSTITPDVADRLAQIDSRICIAPEFLQERNPVDGFLSQQYRIIGISDQGAQQYVEGIFNSFSICDPSQFIPMTAVEAAFYKYAVNTYLAMKVTYMNQLKQLVTEFGGSFINLSRTLKAEPRFGASHMRVPGIDGKEGFGGSCFPKDLAAFIKFADNKTDIDLTLLKQVQNINNEIRSQYDLDEREKEQNVNYGQAKEEQQDKDDGNSKSK